MDNNSNNASFLGLVVIWSPCFFICSPPCHLCPPLRVGHKWHVGLQMKKRGLQITTMPAKQELLLYYYSYRRHCWIFDVDLAGINEKSAGSNTIWARRTLQCPLFNICIITSSLTYTFQNKTKWMKTKVQWIIKMSFNLIPPTLLSSIRFRRRRFG